MYVTMISSRSRDSYTFLYKLDWYDTGLELCVRVRENQDHDFIQRLKADSEKQFRIGNVFISEIRSFKDIRLISSRHGAMTCAIT